MTAPTSKNILTQAVAVVNMKKDLLKLIFEIIKLIGLVAFIVALVVLLAKGGIQ